MAGGTHTPGVPPRIFAMSPGRRMRYDAPDPAIAPFVTAYAVYGHDGREQLFNWFLPAPAMISVAVDAGPLTVTIRHHRFGPLDRVSLYGPTSRAFRTTTHGGIAVGIGLSALGWARLADRPATDFHNRIVPLGSLLGAGLSERLAQGLDDLDDDTQIKPLLDGLLAPLLTRPHPQEALIGAFTALTVEDGVDEIGVAAGRLGIETHELRRIAQRFFGMTPKLLLRRSRFLRAFLRFADPARDPADLSWLQPSYFDVPHFLRDAQTFLGMTPRQFMARDIEYLTASMRARPAVLGAGTQALHDTPARAPRD